MCRPEQRDGDTVGERKTMQLSGQEMLEAWPGEGGRVGERETNLRVSRVLTGLDDQQIWGGGRVRKDQGELTNAMARLVESMNSNETLRWEN